MLAFQLALKAVYRKQSDNAVYHISVTLSFSKTIIPGREDETAR